jgi:SNF2 family DNA or RNA helicase
MAGSKAFTPRPWQALITEHQLEVPRSAQWASMGSGKTASTLSVLDSLTLTESRPALVIAPLRVAQSTWPDEAAKWNHLSHLEVVPIVGDVKARRAALANKNAGIFTTNFEQVPWLVEELGDEWPFSTVIADESTRLKSFRLGGTGGRRARSLARVAHKYVDRFYELSGTPAPNGLIDLWGQMFFLDKGERLGRTFGAFEQRWFTKQPRGSGGFFATVPMPTAQEQIQDRLRDICLTVNVGDYLSIDEPIVNIVKVTLPAKARRIYEDLEKEMFASIGEHEIEAVNAGARTIKCLQLANGAIYHEGGGFAEVHDAKVQALESITEEAMGAPVLVAYHFKSDLARLQRAFPYGRVLDHNPDTIRQWNAGNTRLLFAHPASAGHGLNLQDGGNILVFFGHWWSLEEYQQIIERIGPVRQKQAGHDRPVFIHHIVAADTVDELVMARRESKRSVQDLLLEAMKARG